jgi:hypothetical protein
VSDEASQETSEYRALLLHRRARRGGRRGSDRLRFNPPAENDIKIDKCLVFDAESPCTRRFEQVSLFDFQSETLIREEHHDDFGAFAACQELILLMAWRRVVGGIRPAARRWRSFDAGSRSLGLRATAAAGMLGPNGFQSDFR